jgi:hypothetical protein
MLWGFLIYQLATWEGQLKMDIPEPFTLLKTFFSIGKGKHPFGISRIQEIGD